MVSDINTSLVHMTRSDPGVLRCLTADRVQNNLHICRAARFIISSFGVQSQM